jgi:hypothetical protein
MYRVLSGISDLLGLQEGGEVVGYHPATETVTLAAMGAAWESAPEIAPELVNDLGSSVEVQFPQHVLPRDTIVFYHLKRSPCTGWTCVFHRLLDVRRNNCHRYHPGRRLVPERDPFSMFPDSLPS